MFNGKKIRELQSLVDLNDTRLKLQENQIKIIEKILNPIIFSPAFGDLNQTVATSRHIEELENKIWELRNQINYLLVSDKVKELEGYFGVEVHEIDGNRVNFIGKDSKMVAGLEFHEVEPRLEQFKNICCNKKGKK